MLNGLGDIRIAAVANIIGGIGLVFFGLVPNQFSLVLIFLLVYSTGQHIYMPLSSTIAMTFARGDNFGKRLGQIQGLGSFAIIVSSAILYVVYRFMEVSYQTVFAFAGGAMILAGVLFFMLGHGQTKVVGEKRFVFRKEFKMYYILAIINGARKQIPITFVPWLLIDVYQQPVTTITALFFVVCVINIFFKPWFGGFIDRFGESRALKLEAIVMSAACLGFAFALKLFDFRTALIVACVCYVMDKLMESASMARATYVRKRSRQASDVARTLTMGQSMDHVVSMLIPLAAGYMWYAGGADGYMIVFLGALVISAINYYVAGKL
jgi:MFS family permease